MTPTEASHNIFISYAREAFVGRDEERDLVRQTVDSLRDRANTRFRSPILLFSGVPGIGKSWLLRRCHDDYAFAGPDTRGNRRGCIGVYANLECSADRPFDLEAFCAATQQQIESTLREHGQPMPADAEGNADRNRAAGARFTRLIQSLTDQFVLVFFLDSFGALEDCGAVETFEEQIIGPLTRRDAVLFVLSSRQDLRRWRQFEVRRRIKLSVLEPFNAETTARQVNGVAMIYPYSAGYPVATHHIDKHLQGSQDWEVAIRQGVLSAAQVRLVGKALMEIRDWLLGDFEALRHELVLKNDDELSALRRRFPAVSTLRHFHIKLLQDFLAANENDPGLLQQPDAYFQDVISQLVGTHLARWSSPHHGYRVDPSVRHIMNQSALLEEEKTFRGRHQQALAVYQAWIERMPVNCGSYVIQALYHLAESQRPAGGQLPGTGATSAALRAGIEDLFRHVQPRYFDSDGISEMTDEFDNDSELRGLLGSEMTEVVEGLIQRLQPAGTKGGKPVTPPPTAAPPAPSPRPEVARHEGRSKMVKIPYMALQTPDLIGRSAEIRAIQETIGAHGKPTRVLLLIGDGGIGKTRLLKKAFDYAEQQQVRWVDIDLYYPEQHSNSGIERKIRDSLDPHKSAFTKYRRMRTDFQDMRRRQAPPDVLEAMRSQLTDAFVEGFNEISRNERLLLAFDTTELIEFESELVQSIGQAQEITVEVKGWLMSVIPRLENTAIIFAGRGPRKRPDDPRERLWNLFRATFQAAQQSGHLELSERALSAFDEKESRQYLTEIMNTARRRAEEERLTGEDTLADEYENAANQIEGALDAYGREVYEISEGLPIRLGLLVDLILRDDDFLRSLEQSPPIGWATAAPKVIDRIQEVASQERGSGQTERLLDYLAATRRGLNARLLHHLVPDWSIEQCGQYLKDMTLLSFVKTRPGGDLVFLHDEMYTILAEHWMQKPQLRPLFKGIFERVTQYYDAELRDELPDEQRREIAINHLHYQLYANPPVGYQVYVQRSEAAIKERQTSFDMQLRDEMLRFIDIDDNLKQAERLGLTEAEIERDSAVRWVKRHNARASYDTAIQVAETILHFGPKAYAHLLPRGYQPNASLSGKVQKDAHELFGAVHHDFWSNLLTYYGEALAFAGRYDDALNALNAVVDLLKDSAATFEKSANSQKSHQERSRLQLLGWAHNLLAYVYRRQRRYHTSLTHSHQARHYYRLLEGALDELADVLNDGAFTYALLGDIDFAERWIEHALDLRKRLNLTYPLALSLNTRGLIYLRGDQPRRALAYCLEALDGFQKIGERRGQILALTALGQVYRALANNWRGAIDAQEAISHYTDAEAMLRQAVGLFEAQPQDPLRLMEVHSELGSVYRDWALLERGENHMELAEEKYQAAVEQFRQLIDHDQIRSERPVEYAEACEDLADLYLRWGEPEKAAAVLDRGEAVIPAAYRLTGDARPSKDEQIDAFWQIMGKIYRARASMLFAQVPPAGKLDKEQEEIVFEAVRLSALAVDSFLRFSDRTSMHKGMFKLIYSKLTRYSTEFLHQVRQVVVEAEKQHGLGLGAMLYEMDEMLGLSADAPEL
ncbi:MAG: ATP-binding protein [Anaerolineae bacterium]|nr:ATP-binding protein [Anaerolineae bacterium]